VRTELAPYRFLLFIPSLPRAITAEITPSPPPLAWGQHPPRLLWNVPSIRHRKNELFLTLTEQLTVRRSLSGRLIHSVVTGLVTLNSYLSDYPHLEIEVDDYMLSFSSSSSSTTLTSILPHSLSSLTFLPLDEDMTVSFHSSLSINSALPFLLKLDTLYCDTSADLMSYSVTRYPSTLTSLLSCRVVMESHCTYKVTISSSINSLLQNLILRIPLCSNETMSHPLIESKRINTQVSQGHGCVNWLPERDCLEWRLSTISPHREYSFMVTAHHVVGSEPSFSNPFVLSPVDAQFRVPHELLSNRMRITRVRLHNISSSYRYTLHCRRSTTATEYQIPVEYRDHRTWSLRAEMERGGTESQA
jgi:hypothetical protein